MLEVQNIFEVAEEAFIRDQASLEQEREDDEYLIELMMAYFKRDASRPDIDIKEGGTVEIYVQKLRRTGIPWLKSK